MSNNLVEIFKNHFNRHVAILTKGRPFRCNASKNAFKRILTSDRHMAMHTQVGVFIFNESKGRFKRILTFD